MSLQSTPSAQRLHIGIFGKRNAGKSSIINALTNQNIAIVSDYKGTTTDPVYKAMELLPLGPVMLIDTPGIDDEGSLGKLRIQKTYQVLNKTDVALLVIDARTGATEEDLSLLAHIQRKKLLLLVVFNKGEELEEEQQTKLLASVQAPAIVVSALQGLHIEELKAALTRLQPQEEHHPLLEDLIQPLDLVIMVTPIDASAPKGRLILPQQQVLRNIIDHGGMALVVQVEELAAALAKLATPPRLVITDSQAFAQVAKILPQDVPLTSFSILMARWKGNLQGAVAGVLALDGLQDGDQILISEGCTHHRQCGDIGTVKLPQWIRQYTKVEPKFVFTSGTEFPLDLSPYKLIIHCGGCMLNEKEMNFRASYAADCGLPMTNYGLAIAYMHGILARSVAPLPEIAALLDK